jgi:hypothetical protein
MKQARDHLKELIDGEERLANAIIYSTTQQIGQTTMRTEQKIDSNTRTVEELRTAQQGKRCGVSMSPFLNRHL